MVTNSRARWSSEQGERMREWWDMAHESPRLRVVFAAFIGYWMAYPSNKNDIRFPVFAESMEAVKQKGLILMFGGDEA